MDESTTMSTQEAFSLFVDRISNKSDIIKENINRGDKLEDSLISIVCSPEKKASREFNNWTSSRMTLI